MEELGSILTFAGRPLPSHSAEKFIFLQYRKIDAGTNDSWGLYLQDTSSGKRRLLDEFTAATWREFWVYSQIRTLGWSPDDRYFAYSRNHMKEVVICEANSGKLVAVVPMKEAITSGTWLTSQTLICASKEKIYDFTRTGDSWTGPQENFSLDGLTGPPIELVQAFNSDSLLWKRGDAIWCSRDTNTARKLWQSSANDVLEFTFAYSQEAEKILLLGRDKRSRFFADLFPLQSTSQSILTNVERIEPTDYTPTGVRLINRGRGYAYLNEENPDYSLNFPVVKFDKTKPPLQLPWRGEVKSFDISGQNLFVIGALTNEPTGIWHYDIVSGRLRQLVSNQERAFQYAVSQSPIVHSITNSQAKRLKYYLLAPFREQEKRFSALVIGIMGQSEKAYCWDRYAQALVNCGAYFVMVDRRDSDTSLGDMVERRTRNADQWATDALTVFQALKQLYEIDTNRVFLFGVSGGAVSINKLLETKPELWRGAIFESPASLPHPATVKSKNILVDIGGLDQIWGPNSFGAKKFQDEAARAGASVTLLIRPGVGHNNRVLSIEKERLHQLASFLSKP